MNNIIQYSLFVSKDTGFGSSVESHSRRLFISYHQSARQDKLYSLLISYNYPSYVCMSSFSCVSLYKERRIDEKL